MQRPDARTLDSQWRSCFNTLPAKDRKEQPDNGWSWVTLRGQLVSHFGDHGIAICATTSDGMIQGSILYQTDGVSEIDETIRTVYCHNLATAPWNRSGLVAEPEYRGIGTGLLRLAVLHSALAGFGGRVTLQSYPGRVRVTYQNFGFDVISAPEDGMIMMELDPASAERHLSLPRFDP